MEVAAVNAPCNVQGFFTALICQEGKSGVMPAFREGQIYQFNANEGSILYTGSIGDSVRLQTRQLRSYEHTEGGTPPRPGARMRGSAGGEPGGAGVSNPEEAADHFSTLV